MKLSITDLRQIFPNNRGSINENIMIDEVFTDSRKPVRKGLFIPITGDRFDGHDFLMDAIHNGAVAVLWQKDKPIPSFVPTEFPIFFVSDTIKGLQALARNVLEKTKPLVIGITGSNGKTTTKDLVSAVLQKKYKTYKTQGNLNNHIGMPLTILSMPEGTEVLIVEMGMSNFGEISLLSRIAKPHYGIITNIGESHIEFLGSRQGIARAKLEIIDGLQPEGKLFVDGDEPLLKVKPKDISVIHCGIEATNDIVISNIQVKRNGLLFTIDDVVYELPLLGQHNAKNACLAIALGLELGLTTDQIRAAFSNTHITGMRLEQLRGKNEALIINDAYNSSPTSMKAAIETIKAMDFYDKKVLVLGDSYELGPEEEALHRSVASVIEPPITELICIGEKANWIADEVRKQAKLASVYSFLRKEEALPFILELLAPDTVVLLKASRGARLESLVRGLVEDC